MHFTKLIPNIFYADIQIGLHLFHKCLQFNIAYTELESAHPFCVLEKDGLTVHLIQNEEYALKDRPEIRLVTDDIDAVYAQIKQHDADLLHPNLATITDRPWGAKEFALKDPSDVCVIIQQWT